MDGAIVVGVATLLKPCLQTRGEKTESFLTHTANVCKSPYQHYAAKSLTLY
jgi:hypothetical protein